jgi:hypothetical protein
MALNKHREQSCRHLIAMLEDDMYLFFFHEILRIKCDPDGHAIESRRRIEQGYHDTALIA